MVRAPSPEANPRSCPPHETTTLARRAALPPYRAELVQLPRPLRAVRGRAAAAKGIADQRWTGRANRHRVHARLFPDLAAFWLSRRPFLTQVAHRGRHFHLEPRHGADWVRGDFCAL